jgi:hypothetical protein
MILYRVQKGEDFCELPKPKESNFTGQCFKCGAWRHTQFECPKVQCRSCHMFGHHERVCKRQTFPRAMVRRW